MGFLQTTLERAMVVHNAFPNFYFGGMSQERPWFLVAIWNLIYDFRAQKIVSYYTQIQSWSLTYRLQIAVRIWKGAAFSNALFVGSNRIPFSECFEILTWSIPSPMQVTYGHLFTYYRFHKTSLQNDVWWIFAITKQVPIFFPTWNAWTQFLSKMLACTHFVCPHPRAVFVVSMPCLLKQTGPKQHL